MLIYLRPKFIIIFLFGIASGLPLSLTASTFTMFLADSGIDLIKVGLFSIITTPYAFKYLWAPLLDHFQIPILSNIIGRRKSWLIITQLILAIFICLISLINSQSSPFFIVFIGLAVSFLSATQDIIIDAFRIEMLNKDEQGLGVTSVTIGYRIGMLISSAGALYIAHIWNWQIAYCFMAFCLLPCILVTYIAKELTGNLKSQKIKLENSFVKSFIEPFIDFIKRKYCIMILLIVASYKLSDAYIGIMITPFLLNIGFNKIEIANILKLYGMLATFIGMAVGGYIMNKLHTKFTLIIGAILQGLSNLMFALQSIAGHNTLLLTCTISADNFAGGIGTAALVGYISNLTNKKFTATQYAMLSSIAALCRTTLSTTSGYAATELGWPMFFVASSLLSLPSLILIFYLYYVARDTI